MKMVNKMTQSQSSYIFIRSQRICYKNNVGLSLYCWLSVKTTRLKKLMNRAFKDPFQLVL